MSRILLVDDESDTRDAVSTRLSALDHEVVTAQDGIEALAALECGPVDLMVLDLRMPRLDGLSLLARLQQGEYPHPPTLVMTAHGSPLVRGGVLAFGADDYLEKPFRAEMLERKVARLLQKPEWVRSRRPTVLLVEDEDDVRDAMRTRLEAMGCVVQAAAAWRRGLALAQIERPDLVLLDLRLPETDGHHACFDLKRDPRFEDIPVIVVTACADPAQHEKARLLGAAAVLTKPVSWPRLESLMARVLAAGVGEADA